MLEICVFGPTTVRTPHGILTADRLGGSEPRHILEILSLAAGDLVSKERLADLLWEGRPPRAYLATLESHVCVLRRSLGLVGGRGGALATVSHGYLIDPSAVQVDVVEFRRRALAAEPDRCAVTAFAQLQSGLTVVTGELLAGEEHAGWAVTGRDAFHVELAVVATRAAALLLMTALWRAERRAQALRAFGGRRRHLADELGASPSPASEALFVDLLRADEDEVRTMDAHEEVRPVMGLLRHAVAAIPGARVPADEPGRARMAAELAAAS